MSQPGVEETTSSDKNRRWGKSKYHFRLSEDLGSIGYHIKP